MEGLLRRRLGARLLVERHQVKEWNESEAAKAAGVETKTIRRIERGQNYQWASVEKYALALGHPLEWWLMDVLDKEFRRLDAPSFPESSAATSGERQR